MRALARLAVLHLIGIADGPIMQPQIVERGARHQISIRGVHRHDAVLDLLEKRDRVESSDDGIRRIVLDAEVSGVRNGLEQGEKGLFLLRELGVEPVADLVVVLEAQDDVTLDGVLDGSLDALRGAGHAFRDREALDTSGR